MKKRQQPTDNKEKIQMEHNLFLAISSLKSPDETKKFLEDLCTPAEIKTMAGRWNTVGLIKKGKSYRKICDESGVSATTIGRVARYLMMGAGGYELIYNRLQQQDHHEK